MILFLDLQVLRVPTQGPPLDHPLLPPAEAQV